MASQLQDTILVEVFGSSPETRMISFFMDFPLNDFMQKEVCEATGLNPRTVSARLSKLHEVGVIKDTRKVGKATFYQLNGESPVVRKIDDLVTTISMGVALEERKAEAQPPELVSEKSAQGVADITRPNKK